MATVEKGLTTPRTDMQQSTSANATLNFMPGAVLPASWSGAAAPQHDSYAVLWEPPSSTSTGQVQEQGQDNMSCINLMGRMAYVDHNTGTFNITQGNTNWMGAKYHSTNESLNHDNMNNDPKAISHSHHDLNIGANQEMSCLDPSLCAPHDEEGISSSCVLQPQEGGSLMTKSSLLKRQGVVDSRDSPLLKKQRSSSLSPKETSSKEDPGTSNGSSEVGPALNTNGRPRAKRGSATDPQSVYARQRRERINERLKILQNLVPNGAKVDIVTMLEEAISYVKFLQLQVKLLSSDEYWMYAPTTYNGIDVSFDMIQHSS